ncbi:endonuclease/exonuclease/phosphatase family protein [Mariniphaga anaerophila]|nr:endonuclease/exonuclease/phosphatase family protein [Mariniphaga anaerophila]
MKKVCPTGKMIAGKTHLSVLVIALFLFVSCSSWKNAAYRNMTVVFYNVENLFDVENEPGKSDGEFTPDGQKNWDETRYQKKLSDISNVISGINEGDLPEIVGLCEVENEKVVRDLVQTGLLAKGNYEVVHHESPDFRGIDCALAYRPEEFKVLSHSAVPVSFEDDPNPATRDILYVKGRTRNREEFHVFVNHWPSRIGGVDKTEPKRVAVARVLKSKIDSVMSRNAKAHIIVMGDMNDDPDKKSLSEVLGANAPSTPDAVLVNLMFPDFNNGKGTYNYRGNWNMLDNMIVSPGLLDSKGFRCVEEKGHIFHEEWMEHRSRNKEMSPNRTYGGPNYYGGVSDHFPVYFRLRR